MLYSSKQILWQAIQEVGESLEPEIILSLTSSVGQRLMERLQNILGYFFKIITYLLIHNASCMKQKLFSVLIKREKKNFTKRKFLIFSCYHLRQKELA